MVLYAQVILTILLASANVEFRAALPTRCERQEARHGQQDQQLSREDALLNLNDHEGGEVEVVVQLEIGDHTANVMSANGTLRHWRTSERPALAVGAREDIIGLYDVGDENASFDISELETAHLLADEGEAHYGLASDLAEGVVLTVVWGVASGDHLASASCRRLTPGR